MPDEKKTRQLAEEQAIAYNTRDIDAFCKCFSTTVKVYDLSSNQLLFEGADEFRKRYIERFKDINLHLTVVNKMDFGNFSIDYEQVVMGDSKEMKKVIAIYESADGLIEKVWFIR